MWERLVWEEEIRLAGQKLKPDIENKAAGIQWTWRCLLAESRDGEKWTKSWEWVAGTARERNRVQSAGGWEKEEEGMTEEF